MSEEQKVEQPEAKDNGLAERLAQLEATNKRLLEESKAYKEKYQKTRDEVAAKEKEALEKTGSKDELLERYKNEAFEYQQKMDKLKRKALEKELKFEVAKHATDAYKLEAVVKNLPTSLIQLDEETLSVSGVKEAIDHLRKEDSYLFKPATQPSVVTSRPSAMPLGQKPLAELSAKEKDARLKEALSQIIK